jgi:hypothetical protein
LATPRSQPAQTIWGSLETSQRRLISAALILGFSQLILVDLYFRLQELPQINGYLAGGSLNFVEDGIEYPPFALSGVACGVMIAASIILVNSSVKGASTLEQRWLGSAWLLASAALVLDLMIDTFEVKWPVIILFAYVGFRYWKGSKRNALAVILAPSVAVIATLDGLNHLSGQDCVQSGLDACPGKAVSDIYLVIILLVLTYLTTIGLNQRASIHIECL